MRGSSPRMTKVLFLPVLTRRPEHVARALVVGVAARDEQEVGEPVDVFQRRRRDVLTGLVLEFHHDTLGAPAYRARQMQIGRRRAAARQDEGTQRLQSGVESVNLAL